ncbi:hypothetical protein EJ08DRAFT_709856 [Tothia fuscella]|uniref:Uncharacterized protein n=1 Tax=Tothia fuscella TaxID=1048955 RepID=A0A9P4U122_9PEZI|nr:hypothetical protein EJ08DRAFT_709856 [Tothia fuscella]
MNSSNNNTNSSSGRQGQGFNTIKAPVTLAHNNRRPPLPTPSCHHDPLCKAWWVTTSYRCNWTSVERLQPLPSSISSTRALPLLLYPLIVFSLVTPISLPRDVIYQSDAQFLSVDHMIAFQGEVRIRGQSTFAGNVFLNNRVTFMMAPLLNPHDPAQFGPHSNDAVAYAPVPRPQHLEPVFQELAPQHYQSWALPAIHYWTRGMPPVGTGLLQGHGDARGLGRGAGLGAGPRGRMDGGYGGGMGGYGYDGTHDEEDGFAKKEEPEE